MARPSRERCWNASFARFVYVGPISYLSIYWIRLIRMVVITPTTGYCGHGLIVAITQHYLLIIL
jgi:hypothetical protein